MGIDHAVRFAGERAPDDVDNGHDASALYLRLARGSQRIRRLARLRDGDEQIVFLNQWIAISKFRGDIDLHRRFDHLFEQIFPD